MQDLVKLWEQSLSKETQFFDQKNETQGRKIAFCSAERKYWTVTPKLKTDV